MNCPVCGAQVQKGQKYCESCGFHLEKGNGGETVSPVQKAGEDKHYGRNSLIFGILSIALNYSAFGSLLVAVILMLAVIICSILGIVFSAKGWRTKERGMAVGGMVCSILGIVILVISFCVSFLVSYMAAFS